MKDEEEQRCNNSTISLLIASMLWEHCSLNNDFLTQQVSVQFNHHPVKQA